MSKSGIQSTNGLLEFGGGASAEVEVDNITIQENSGGELETVLKTFVGTSAEWAAVTNKSYYDIVNITDDGTVVEDVYEAIHDAVNTVTSGTATFNSSYGAGDIRWTKCGRIVTVYVWFNITTAIPANTTYITGLPASAGMVGDMVQLFTTTGAVVWFMDANGTSIATTGATGNSPKGGGRGQITYISAE